MDYGFSELLGQVRDWVRQAVDAGWLSNQHLENVTSLEIGSPSSLFAETTQRPLVVALFGGTGVGKSSLLNRLAGEDIARTGVERPTSREISAYLHESVELKHLPKDFPTDKIKIATHGEDRKKHILWIDMPDFDSTERKNSEIVLSWLPHIDVLLYVVSPERYRDNKGWRLLLEKGEQHAWLFVMNQWDKGTDVQFKDFQRQITIAGFEEAIVLRTDCVNNTSDDFAELEQAIGSLAESNIVSQLEQHGSRVRIQELAEKLGESIASFGSQQDTEKILANWDSTWKATQCAISEGLAWPIQQIADEIVAKGPKRLRAPTAAAEGPDVSDESNDQSFLWDKWAQTRVEDAIDGVLVTTDSLSIPIKPLKAKFVKVKTNAPGIVNSHLEKSVRDALAKPGTKIQRILLFIFKVAAFVLPLAALAWVGYRLFYSYYQTGLAGGDYLGVNFAIHSGLLVVTSWLIPWFLHRKLKPSPEHSAMRGLRHGLAFGLTQIEADIEEAIDDVNQEKLELINNGQRLYERCEASLTLTSNPDDGVLGRVLKND